MANFFDLPTKTFDLGDGNTVTIRKLTFSDMQKVWNDKELHDGPEDTFQSRLTALVVRLAICDWAGPGFEGHAVSAENIALLPWTVINQFGAETLHFCMLTDDEKKASGADTK